MKKSGELRMKYQYECKPMQECIDVANRMHCIDEEDTPYLLKYKFVKDIFDEELINSLAKMFCDIKRVNIFVQSRSLINECKNDGPMFKTKYDIGKLDEFITNAIE